MCSAETFGIVVIRVGVVDSIPRLMYEEVAKRVAKTHHSTGAYYTKQRTGLEVLNVRY